MRLSKIGMIARECWFEIPLHYPFVVLDEFIVMPNHVHGILRIINVVTDARFCVGYIDRIAKCCLDYACKNAKCCSDARFCVATDGLP